MTFCILYTHWVDTINMKRYHLFHTQFHTFKYPPLPPTVLSLDLLSHYFVLFERLRNSNGQWEIFHPLVSSLNSWNSLGWTISKPEAQNLIQASHFGGRDPTACAITRCLPECTYAGSWSRMQNWDTTAGTLIHHWQAYFGDSNVKHVFCTCI